MRFELSFNVIICQPNGCDVTAVCSAIKITTIKQLTIKKITITAIIITITMIIILITITAAKITITIIIIITIITICCLLIQLLSKNLITEVVGFIFITPLVLLFESFFIRSRIVCFPFVCVTFVSVLFCCFRVFSCSP